MPRDGASGSGKGRCSFVFRSSTALCESHVYVEGKAEGYHDLPHFSTTAWRINETCHGNRRQTGYATAMHAATRPRHIRSMKEVPALARLRIALRCHGDVRLMLLPLEESGARKAVATDTAFVQTARYAKASRAILWKAVRHTRGLKKRVLWSVALLQPKPQNPSRGDSEPQQTHPYTASKNPRIPPAWRARGEIGTCSMTRTGGPVPMVPNVHLRCSYREDYFSLQAREIASVALAHNRNTNTNAQ